MVQRALVIIAVLCLNGCAAYTVASTATLVTTDKSLTDHAMTQVTPNGDCSIMNLFKGLYYCEIRDISKTYNRNPI
jgi:hypothetical protein